MTNVIPLRGGRGGRGGGRPRGTTAHKRRDNEILFGQIETMISPRAAMTFTSGPLSEPIAPWSTSGMVQRCFQKHGSKTSKLMQRMMKMPELCETLGVNHPRVGTPDEAMGWELLALALAIEFVPGFRIWDTPMPAARGKHGAAQYRRDMAALMFLDLRSDPAVKTDFEAWQRFVEIWHPGMDKPRARVKGGERDKHAYNLQKRMARTIAKARAAKA